MSDTSGPNGTWYLNARNSRLTLSITTDQSGSLSGTLTTDKDITDVLDNVSWNPTSRTLEFRRNAQHFFEWYRGTVVEGVLVGRFSHSSRSERPSKPTSFTSHVTGWNREYLDGDIVPRVYEVTIMKDLHGRLRIDRAADGSCLGRLKVYRGPHGEELEYDLEVTSYSADGVRFIRHTDRGPEEYEGLTQGRTIAGTLRQNWTTRTARWNGYRAEVLTYGLTPKSASDRASWQDRTRQQLYHLMMAGNPKAMCTEVVVGPVKQPFRGQFKAGRDDDPENHPQNYQLVELHFHSTVPNPYSTGVIQRKAHGYLAAPTEVPPRGGFPAVLALNGHSGSAYQVMNPGGGSTGYWYGDAFARRGFVVLALDIGHRSDSPLYDDDHSTSGDDPDHGNGPHPSIKPPKTPNPSHRSTSSLAYAFPISRNRKRPSRFRGRLIPQHKLTQPPYRIAPSSSITSSALRPVAGK